jgi:hypothetical protein
MHTQTIFHGCKNRYRSNCPRFISIVNSHDFTYFCRCNANLTNYQYTSNSYSHKHNSFIKYTLKKRIYHFCQLNPQLTRFYRFFFSRYTANLTNNQWHIEQLCTHKQYSLVAKIATAAAVADCVSNRILPHSPLASIAWYALMPPAPA